MRMKLFKLIEFKDAAGSAEGYDSGDEIIQEYTLGSPKGGKGNKKQGELWDPISEVSDVDNPDVKTFSAKTSDGVFEVIGRYAGKPVTFMKEYTVGEDGNTSTVSYDYELHPNNVKFDYIVRNFPFMSDESMLAFDGRFKTISKIKPDESRENGLDAPNDESGEYDNGARFSWSPTVNVDGVETPVVFSLKEATAADDDEEVSKKAMSEKNMQVVWTIKHTGKAASFIWDPTLTAATEDTNGLSPSERGVKSSTESLHPMRVLIAILQLCIVSFSVGRV
jgi:hypothetical protein